MSQLYGLLGEKLKHSFSPIIHSEIFKELDIKGNYHLFEVNRPDLKNAILGLRSLKAKGTNVTIPYKVEAMKYLDDISIEAKRIGAVNTIAIKDNKTIGYNTDYHGFGMMLDNYEIDIKNKKAVVLGTGGAAKSVIQYLIDNEIGNVMIVSRNASATNEKFSGFNIISYNEIQHLKNQDIVINCTPCGMYPNVENSPITKNNVSKFHTVIDLIYNPLETLFLRYANELGLKGVNGLYMLVGQAVKAEELWNNTVIESNITKKIYDKIIKLI